MGNLVREYRSINKRVEHADKAIEPDKWKLCELAHAAVMSGGYTRKRFAEETGVSASQVANQVAIWANHSALLPADRPTYSEAYASLGPNASNFKKAPTAAEVVNAVATRPEVARAVVRDERAMGTVAKEREADYKQRHDPNGTLYEDPAKAGRRAGENMGKRLGLRGDRATEELRRAAGIILEAKKYCDEFGIEDGDAEHAAITRVKRALKIYETQADLTDADRVWANEIGVTV